MFGISQFLKNTFAFVICYLLYIWQTPFCRAKYMTQFILPMATTITQSKRTLS